MTEYRDDPLYEFVCWMLERDGHGVNSVTVEAILSEWRKTHPLILYTGYKNGVDYPTTTAREEPILPPLDAETLKRINAYMEKYLTQRKHTTPLIEPPFTIDYRSFGYRETIYLSSGFDWRLHYGDLDVVYPTNYEIGSAYHVPVSMTVVPYRELTTDSTAPAWGYNEAGELCIRCQCGVMVPLGRSVVYPGGEVHVGDNLNEVAPPLYLFNHRIIDSKGEGCGWMTYLTLNGWEEHWRE